MPDINNKILSSLSILSIAGVKPYPENANEEYMNELQILHFKKILKAWRQQLLIKSGNSVHFMKNETVNFPDPIDRAVQEEEFNLKLRTRDIKRKLLQKIEHTLGRIEKKDFGFCASCGIEIGIRRLEANPNAELCIECKTLAEIREKQILG
ncbi:MAG: RNA polymerase-binding protein DksA [Candidatus Dasytiphilus stammeri]